MSVKKPLFFALAATISLCAAQSACAEWSWNPFRLGSKESTLLVDSKPVNRSSLKSNPVTKAFSRATNKTTGFISNTWDAITPDKKPKPKPLTGYGPTKKAKKEPSSPGFFGGLFGRKEPRETRTVDDFLLLDRLDY